MRSRHSTIVAPEFHAKAPQATVSERFAQGPYVAARAGEETHDPSDERSRLNQCATHAPICAKVARIAEHEFGNRWGKVRTNNILFP